MAIGLNVADYIVILAMLCVSAAVGLYFRFTGGKQKTVHEFLKGGKNMSILPVTFSLMATAFSAVSILGNPAEVYLYGSYLLLSYIAYSIGGLIAVYTVLPVFFDMDVSTIYEYLERRFGKTIRYVASLLFCVQMILYSPIVIYAPSLALSTVTGLSLWISIVSMAVVCTFYSSLGGLKAVLWTDLFQSFLMFITLFLVITKGCLELGGISHVFEIAKEGGRLAIFNSSTSFLVRYTTVNCLLQGFTLGFYKTGTCHVQVQRLMSVKNLKRAQRSFLLSIPLSLLFKSLCCMSGILMYSFFHNCNPLEDPNSDIKSSDQIFPYLALKLYSDIPGLSGLCIAGIFSASLSTMSSSLNSLVAVCLEDLIRPLTLRNPLTDSRASFIAKILGIVYGGLCILLVFVIANTKGILEASILMNGLVGGPILGIYALGIFTSSANEMGTLIGLFSGFSLNAWMAFGSLYNKPKYPSLPLSVAGCEVNNTSYLNFNPEANYYSNHDLKNLTESFSVAAENERYVFPLYSISFMWFAFISCITVIFVGYISSILIRIWKKQKPVHPQYFSPVVKKWMFKISQNEEHHLKEPLNFDQMELKKTSCALSNGNTA